MVNTRSASKVGRSRAKAVVWWAVRSVAALVLGVATTLAVAYGGAVMDSETDFGGYGDGSAFCMLETNRWWDVVHVGASSGGIENVRRVRSIGAWSEDVNEVGDEELNGILDSSEFLPREVVMIGWPARCLWGVETQAFPAEREGLVDVPEWIENIRFVRERLPVNVWWPGMAANVAVFGGAWLVVLGGWPAWHDVRGWRRRQKGLCVGCGYDVKGAGGAGGVCPECGRAA